MKRILCWGNTLPTLLGTVALLVCLSFSAAAQTASLQVVTDCPGPFIPGTDFTCTHTVTNNGPDPAISVVMSDEWVDVDLLVSEFGWDSDWSCGADMTCTRAGLMPIATPESISIQYHLPANAHIVDPDGDWQFQLGNDITADNDKIDHFALSPFTMTPQVDLVVDVVALTPNVAIGGSGQIEVVIRNNGPSDVDGANFYCLISGWAGFGGVSPDFGNLYIPAGETRDFMFDVELLDDAAVGDTITVGAGLVSLPAGYTEIAEGDEEDLDTITVIDALPPADVSIAVAADPLTVTAGGDPTLVTLTITNNGPGPAEGVSVHDLFFLPWSIGSISFTGPWSLNGAFSAVRQQPMPAGTVETITFTLYVPASQEPGGWNNYAFVSADNPDPDTSNNMASTSYEIVREVDLVVNVVTISKQVAPGGWGLTEVIVRNNGPSDVDGQTAVITVSGSAGFGGYSSDFGTLHIPAGDTRDLVFGVQVNEDAAVGSVITIEANIEVPAGYTEVGDGDETDSDTLTVVDALPDADVAVTDVRLISGDPVVPGSLCEFEIDAVNNGPADASGAVLTTLFFDVAYMPNNTNLPTGWNVGGSGGTWTRQSVWPVGVAQTFWVQVIVPPDAHYKAGLPIDDFRAFVAAANPDTVPANNTDMVFFGAQAQSTLTIEKTLLNEEVAPGGTAFYAITVTNTGPSDIDGVAVVDTPGANLDAATLVLSPDAGNLYVPAGQSRTVTATVQVAATAVVGDSFENSAAVSAAGAVGGVGSTLAPVVNEPSTGDVAGTVGHYLPPADVSIAVAMAPSPVTAGGAPIRVTLTVTNNGPSPAEGVSVHDLFFFPWRVDNISHPGYSINGAFSGVRQQPMPAGAVDTISFDLYVPASAEIRSYYDYAFVAADNPDPNTGNNAGVATYTVVGEATLSVEKTDLVDPVGQGQMLLYEIEVRNEGPTSLPAGSVVVVDTLDPLVQFAGASPGCIFTGPPLPGTGGIVTCTVGGVLGVNESADFLIQVKVPFGTPTGTILTNSVTAGAPSLDPAEWTVTGDSDSVDTEVAAGPVADLRITKMVKPDGQVPAGEVFTYWIYVENMGPSDAVNLTMIDNMISDGDFSVLTIESDRGGTGTLITPVGVIPDDLPAASVDHELSFQYELATLAAWDRWTIKLTATANETVDVNNMARVFAEDPTDPNIDNNYADDAINVDDVADLALTKTAVGNVQVDGEPAGVSTPVANEVTAGLALTYTLAVSNDGPSTAANVMVSDQLPWGVCITGMTPSRGTCQLGIPGDPAAPVTWGVGTLAPGESASLDIAVLVSPDVRDGTMLTNSAVAFSDVFDANIGDNRAWNLTAVNAAADLSITKEDTPDPVANGGLLTYKIVFVNDGPSTASGVAIVDMFPEGVQIVSVDLFDVMLKSLDSCNCVVYTDRVICQVGDIAVDEGGTLIIVAQVPANTPDTTLVNEATISGRTDDPDETNNTVSIDTGVLGCTVPAAPEHVWASNGTDDAVLINWHGSAGATHYEVYRSTVEDFAAAELIGSTVETTFMDLDPESPHLDNGGCRHYEPTIAYYWVVAVNDCGDSVPSAPDEGFEHLFKSASISSQAGNFIIISLLLACLYGFKRPGRRQQTP